MINESLCMNHSIANIGIIINYLFEKYLQNIRLINMRYGENVQTLNLVSKASKSVEKIILAKLPVNITTQYDAKEIFTNNLYMYVLMDYGHEYIHLCFTNNLLYYTRHTLDIDSNIKRKIHLNNNNYWNIVSLTNIILSTSIDQEPLQAKDIIKHLIWMTEHHYITECLTNDSPLKLPTINDIGALI